MESKKVVQDVFHDLHNSHVGQAMFLVEKMIRKMELQQPRVCRKGM